MTLPVVFTANGPSGYNLTNSLRFRASASAYLNRTPASSSNRKTWTWSGWVKRGTLGTDQVLFGAYDNSSASDATYTAIYLSGNTITVGGWTLNYRITNAVYRDPSAWYHIVIALDTTQATANNRVKVYVNGSEVTAFSTTNNPSQNADLGINLTQQHGLGRINYLTGGGPYYFDGYLAEVNFIDGQALTPSSFGQTSATTGVWQPIKYTGTYGTNGFYLPFTDNSALTTSSNAGLGKDFSGNSNYWTTNNISITSGSTYDSMTDVPTLTSATAANYAVMNPLAKDSDVTISNGNLNFDCTSGGLGGAIGTIAVSSGKWYWEVVTTGGIGGVAVGIAKLPLTAYDANQTGTYLYLNGGDKRLSPSTDSAYGASYTTNDVIGVALDMDAGTVTFYKNNTSQGTAFSSLSGDFTAWVQDGSNGDAVSSNINFGQRPFAYTPPTGFKALNTFNLPTPTIGATASTQANDYFNTVLYSGNNSTQNIAVGFQPDFVWSKCRNVGRSHRLSDAVRGSTKDLYSDTTGAEQNDGSITSFISTGFSLDNSTGSAYNTSGETYVSWAWKANGSGSSNTSGSITSTVSANTSAGFSIVTYTGNGTSGATVGHGLGVAPSMYIVKSRSAANNWCVYHVSLGNQYATLLNSTAGSYSNSNYWNNTSPTSTIFSLGNGGDTNQSSATFVAYCFAQIAGYSAFGSYTGNGSTDGPFIYTGFRPRFVLVKRTDSTSSWGLIDTARDTYNVTTKLLFPNASDAENTSYTPEDILSNGFKLRDTTYNISSGTYIYMAFAENPFKYSLAR